MALVSDAISDALRRIGVIAPNETASPVNSAICFNALNVLNDSWGAERLTIPYIARTVATLTANQSSFTVGTGGNINIVRPDFITGIKFQDTSQSPTLEMPLQRWTDDQYQAQPIKGLTSTLPVAAYYNPTYAGGTGTLIPWPIPTSTTLQWVIYSPVALAQFSATSSTLVYPPGYHRFIVLSLAYEVAPIFGVPQAVRDAVEKDMNREKANIKTANFRLSDLSTDVAWIGSGGRGMSYYDFVSGNI